MRGGVGGRREREEVWRNWSLEHVRLSRVFESARVETAVGLVRWLSILFRRKLRRRGFSR